LLIRKVSVIFVHLTVVVIECIAIDGKKINHGNYCVRRNISKSDLSGPMSKMVKLAGLDPVENIRNVPSSTLGGATKK
jgi:hypothetical protein